MEEGSTATMTTATISTNNSNSPPPFLSKTYDMVDDPSTNSTVSWSESGNSFVVWDVAGFSRDLLPKHFKHSNFSSFVRQLNTYGFRKVDADRWEFANEWFLRGQKHLLKSINRRKPAHAYHHTPAQQERPSVQIASSCVELGKFGLDGEIGRLKRDKNVLMQELVRLRQQQQSTDNQLQSVGQRIQVMEQRQQKMMSFLAKAMQSPGFLAQIVQHQNESGGEIIGSNKKRRLPMHNDVTTGVMKTAPLDGQIVKYQPVMNEAAKSVLRQIFKLNSSPRLDQSVIDPGAFLIDSISSPSGALSNRGPSGWTKGLTLPASSGGGELSIPAGTPSSLFTAPAAASTVQCSTPITSASVEDADFLGVVSKPSLEGILLSDYEEMQEVLPQNSLEFNDISYAGSQTHHPGNGDTTMTLETDQVLADAEFGGSDSVSMLPGSNDVFWEQFLSVTPFPMDDDTEEVDSSSPEEVGREQDLQFDEDEGWNKINDMNLMEQMGLLVVESKGV